MKLLSKKIIIMMIALSVPMSFAYAQKTDKKTRAVLKKMGTQIKKHDKIKGKAKTFAIKTLLGISTNRVLVKAAIAQNAKKTPLSEIQKIDKDWINAEEEMPIQKAVRNNKCGKELMKIVKKNRSILEIFVMDNQGAVVCENNLTSDYWQGDEAKWKNSFKNGKGGVDAGGVKFDKSANANIQQISLPLIGKKGIVIGAITFGVSL